MRKLVIVSYYELKDYFLSIAETFSDRYQWEVVNYPLYMYCYDKNSKIDDYDEHFSAFLKKEKPHLLLWWLTDIKLSLFHKIKKEHPNIYYVLYNFNDPMNLNVSFFNKCKIFDLIMTNCAGSVSLYKIHVKNKNIMFFPFPYDDELYRHYDAEEIINFDSKYMCDIAMHCDSLITTDRAVDRKKIIAALDKYAQKHRVKFNLYGPDILATISPNYVCDLPYIDTGPAFTMCRINVVTHVRADREMATGTHEMASLACASEKTAILMDAANGARDFYDYAVTLFDNEESLILRLDELLVKTSYSQSAKRANEISREYTWNGFANMIYRSYIKHAFDHEFYTRTYRVVDEYDSYLSRKAAYAHFVAEHNAGNMMIPYVIKVPSNFDLENYYETQLADQFDSPNDVEPEYIYIHWYHNGANGDYMKRITSDVSVVSGSSVNILTPKLFDLFRGFNMIHIYQDTNTGFDVLQRISEQNPDLKINDALNHYLDLSAAE